MRRGRAFRAGRRAQRGIVFYLFVVFTLTTLAIMAAGAAMVQGLPGADRDAERLLAEARRAVIAHLSQPDVPLNAADAGRRLGEWRLTPDLPVAAGGGEDAVEPSYDGLAETGGCATRAWVPGQPLQPVAASGAAARCFGRLPWRTLGVALPDADVAGNDVAGAVPWVVLSPNLAAGAACLPNLNPLMLSVAWGGYGCPAAVPHPWLRVVDERGNLLSDRVAFAVILPGPPHAGQVRGPAAGPGAWLDSLTVAPGCLAPCVPGTYDNAGYAHADAQPTTLVRGPRPGTAVDRTTNHVAPVRFNDRLVYVTADELFEALAARARTELDRRLRDVRTAAGHFPWAAPFGSAAGDCVPGVRFGHPAVTCATGPVAALPAWLTGAGWHRWFVYAVSSRCVQGSAACNAPGLTVGARNDVNALLIEPGRAIRNPPFAPSRLLAQQPLNGLLTSALPADFLDSVQNASNDDVFEPVPVPSASNNDRLAIVQ